MATYASETKSPPLISNWSVLRNIDYLKYFISISNIVENQRLIWDFSHADEINTGQISLALFLFKEKKTKYTYIAVVFQGS